MDLDPTESTRASRSQKEKSGSVGFPDSDGELEKELEEGRIISGPASLQSLGEARRRKDAIAAGVKPVSVPLVRPVLPSTPTPSTHAPAQAPSKPQLHSISETLKDIPLEIWEGSTPVLDALIKETLRIAQPHTAMRRNVGPEFYINEKLVPTGAYVVYPFSDVHLDEDLYQDAWKFDPGRWLNGGDEACGADTKQKKGKEVPFRYVGWGAGEF